MSVHTIRVNRHGRRFFSQTWSDPVPRVFCPHSRLSLPLPFPVPYSKSRQEVWGVGSVVSSMGLSVGHRHVLCILCLQILAGDDFHSVANFNLDSLVGSTVGLDPTDLSRVVGSGPMFRVEIYPCVHCYNSRGGLTTGREGNGWKKQRKGIGIHPTPGPPIFAARFTACELR